MTSGENLKALIFKMTGKKAKLSSLQQDKMLSANRKADRQKPPYHFLVTGISERAHNVLLHNSIILTKDVTAFIVPYSPPTPRFLLSIEGFTLSIKDQEVIQEAEQVVTRIVQESLSRDESFVSLLKSKLTDNPTSQHNPEPALNIIAALEIRLAVGEGAAPRTSKFGAKKPTWNIYFANDPHVTWHGYFAILQATHTMTFIDLDYGTATPLAKDNQLHCYNCKGADYNQSHCAYTNLAKWFTNTIDVDKIEETAEFAASSKPTRGGNNTDRRRGPPRGRGRGFGGGGAIHSDQKYGRH